MTRLSKKRRIALAKPRAVNGTFIAENNELNFEEEAVVEDWGNDDDSEWEDIDLKLAETNYKRLLNVELIWKKDAYLEKKTRGPYLVGPTKKSTFYDNYGPTGKWTKAAEGTSKLTNFFSSNKDDNIKEVLAGGDKWNFKEIEVKVEGLKEELRNN